MFPQSLKIVEGHRFVSYRAFLMSISDVNSQTDFQDK